jgi:hypothetical protein
MAAGRARHSKATNQVGQVLSRAMAVRSHQHTSAPTVSSRDTGQGSKENKENVSEGSLSSTIVHVMRKVGMQCC